LSIELKAEDEKYVALFKKTNVPSQLSSNNGGFESGSSPQVGYRIDRHGNIRLPIIGEINVLGYTTKEVRLKLEEELLKYLKSKDKFFVTVDLSGIKYTVIGEIQNPGPKVIYQNKVSILDAISNSGDITVTGNKKKVEVWRNTINTRTKRLQILVMFLTTSQYKENMVTAMVTVMDNMETDIMKMKIHLISLLRFLNC